MATEFPIHVLCGGTVVSCVPVIDIFNTKCPSGLRKCPTTAEQPVYKKIAKKMTNLGQKGLRNYGEPFPLFS